MQSKTKKKNMEFTKIKSLFSAQLSIIQSQNNEKYISRNIIHRETSKLKLT